MNDQTTKDRSNIWSAIAVVLSLISATILLIQNPASAATGQSHQNFHEINNINRL